METTKKKIPNFVLEDLLFQRRLQRNLGDELERLYHLLVEQVRLLKERETLLTNISEAVQRRWEKEEPSDVIDRTEPTEEEANHE
jgi:hypothetical protein